jgi:sec-independent protein translocase protein TatB
MLFDIGWSELLLIGVVALVFIGPKDLPRALRVAGYWFRKAQNLSREFQSSVDQMIREAELDEMREQLKKATEFDIEKEFHKTVDPTGELAESIKPPGVPDFFEAAPSSSEAMPASASAETPASEAAAALPAPAEAPLPVAAPEPQPQPEPATTTEHAVDPVPPVHQPEPPKP